jgi:uncharacterized protein (DUF1778 family)
MSAIYSNTGKQAVNADLIREAVSNAVFDTNDFVAKGAVPKARSRFADPAPVDPKHEKVTAAVVIDIGQLPPNEKALMIDLFDRYSEVKNGKLSVSQHYMKDDFNADKSQETIMSFIESKIDKAFGIDQNRSHSIASIPDASTIDVNERSKTNIVSWLKNAVSPKPQPSQEASFGR